MNRVTHQLNSITRASAAVLSGSGRDSLRWFAGAPNPELQAMAAGFELKGCRGSARTLAGKTVSIAGLGAVGGDACCTLSRAGVGNLQGFDSDSYEAESWLTQPVNPADVGRLKAEVQGERAHTSGSGHVITAAAFAQDIPWWVLRKSDALLTAGDTLEILVWAGEAACRFGIPLLQGAVHGETWSAFVRAYDFRSEGGPCPCCAFSKAEWLQLKSRQGCDPGMMRAQGGESTRSLPNVCRAAADLLSSEALKVLLGIEGCLVNEELAYCLLSHRVIRTEVEHNPDCRCPHQRWNFVDVARSQSETTIEMLAGEVGEGRTLDRLQVRGELPWVSFSYCARCGRKIPIRQFGRVGGEFGNCGCGESVRAIPMGMRSAIPQADLHEVADMSLAVLRLPAGAAIGLANNTGTERPNWFFVGPPPDLQAEPFREQGGISTTATSIRSIAK